MSKKKQKPETIKEVGGQEEIRRLWTKISPSHWFGLLQEIAPHNKWQMQGRTTIKGCCPYHNDHTPSFVLQFQRGFGKCHEKTCRRYVSDPVQLVAKLMNTNFTQALMFLSNRFDLSDILLTNADELEKYNKLQEMKKQAAIAMNRVLLEVIRDDPDHLAYCRPVVAYLKDVRKIPLDVIHALPVGVFAKPEHLKKHMPDEIYHSEMEEYFSKYRSTAFWGAVAFHYNDSPGTISRFKLRLRDNSIPGGVPKTDELAALDAPTKAKLITKELVYTDDPYCKELGVFGLHKYQHLIGSNDTNAYIHRGRVRRAQRHGGPGHAGLLRFHDFRNRGQGQHKPEFLAQTGDQHLLAGPGPSREKRR